MREGAVWDGVAETLHARLAQGYRIEKVELVLEWEKQEGPRPERGRSGWGAEDLYQNSPGQWHVIARALRNPWSTDLPQLGPIPAMIGASASPPACS